MEISLYTSVRIKLTEQGIETFLSHVDKSVEIFCNRYELGEIEKVSYRMNLESMLKDGILTCQLKNIFDIFGYKYDNCFDGNIEILV